MEMRSEVPPECEILVNGEVATLDRLEVGDRADVKAEFLKGGKNPIRPLSIHVRRAIATTLAPPKTAADAEPDEPGS